jgi:hypothetical protein
MGHTANSIIQPLIYRQKGMSVWYLQAFEPPLTLTAVEGTLAGVGSEVFPQARQALTGH